MDDVSDHSIAGAGEFGDKGRAFGWKLLVPQPRLLDAELLLEYCADGIGDVGEFLAVVEQRDARAAQGLQAGRKLFGRGSGWPAGLRISMCGAWCGVMRISGLQYWRHCPDYR